MPDTYLGFAALVMTLACLSIMGRFMQASRRKEPMRAMFYKGLASLCFLAVGLLGLLRLGDWDYGWKAVAGLFLGFCGDELLAMRFIREKKHDLYFSLGAVAFSLGHVLFIWAAIERSGRFSLWTLPILALLLLCSGLYARKKESHAGDMHLNAVMYICLVCCMGAVTCGAALARPDLSSALFALGGLSFVVSDNILCAHHFGNDSRFLLNWLIHISYYGAQLLIAWSVFFA